MSKRTGAPDEHSVGLPKGPVGREKLALECYDRLEAALRKLPEGLEWRSATLVRTPNGIACRVTI